MKIAIYCAAGAGALMVLFIWLVSQIHYRIGSRHLKVMVLGIPMRRIPLDRIVGVSKREPKGMAEHWTNTFKTTHRLLTIELNKGFRKYICITPRNRYVFVADLKSAVRRVNPASDWARLNTPEENTSLISKKDDLPDAGKNVAA